MFAHCLGSASYDEISDLRTDPFGYSLTRRGTGGDLSAAPTDQGFWTAQSSGPGTQTLTWDLKPGTYTAVIMNVDGSPGVAGRDSLRKVKRAAPVATRRLPGGSRLVPYPDRVVLADSAHLNQQP